MPKIIPDWELLQAFTRPQLPTGASKDLPLIAGIDEVGRGTWAGPVVAAAVVLPWGRQFEGLGDSKIVPVARRNLLDCEIKAQALAIGIGWVSAADIDAHGLSWAVRESGLRALANLGPLTTSITGIVLDGSHNYLADDPRAMVIVKGDAYVTPVAAASIIAKVARDKYMNQVHRQFPDYGFYRHVGYGTAQHRQAIAAHGVSPEHRLSIKPLRTYQVASSARILHSPVSTKGVYK